MFPYLTMDHHSGKIKEINLLKGKDKAGMNTPKPQFRPQLQAPAFRPPKKQTRKVPVVNSNSNKKITECIHVLKGAVWCNDCARTFRTQSREIYARALRESQRGDVLRAAQARLAKALKEYALTPEGIAELERDYARLISVKRPDEAAKVLIQITSLRKEVSERNISSRKDEACRQARMNTALSHAKTNRDKYIQAPLDENRTWTTKGSSYGFTYHMKERMELRSISDSDVDVAFHDFESVTPRGAGKWCVAGKNGVTLYGFFERTSEGQMNFIVTTVFRPAETNENGEIDD